MRTHVLRGPLEQTRGVIGRYPEPGECYVFPYDAVARRGMHMVGVPEPLRVGWYVDGALVAEEVLRPWLGLATHIADMVVETHPDSELPRRAPEVVA